MLLGPRIAALILVVVFVCIPHCASANTPPRWSHSEPSGIEWYVTASDVLVIGTWSALYGLDQNDGTELWRIEAREIERHQIVLVPFTHEALVTFPRDPRSSRGRLALVDLTSGRELWSGEKNGLSSVFGVYAIPARDALLVYGRGRSSDTPWMKLVDHASGSVLWEVEDPFHDGEPEFFGRGAQPALIVDRATVILFLHGDAARKYDLRDGRLVWEAQDLQRAGRGVSALSDADKQLRLSTPTPAPARGYAPVIVSADRRLFFAPHHNTVGAFSCFNGARRWINPDELPGLPTQMEIVPQGLLVRTRPETDELGSQHWLTLLDVRNGRVKWKSPQREGGFANRILGTWSHASNFLVEDARVIVASDDALFAIEIETGLESRLCSLEFESSDKRRTLERRGNEYLINGGQTIVWCDTSGTVSRRAHFDPPDGVRTGFRMLLESAMTDVIEQVYFGWLFDATGSDYSPAFSEMFKEYSATTSGLDYLYVLAEDDRGSAILRLRKDDGTEAGRVRIDEAMPNYQVCPFTGNLYWSPNPETISCYIFP